MVSDDDEPLFVMLGRLAAKDGAIPLNKNPGCWTRAIGKEWWVAINGHPEPQKASSPNGASAGQAFTVEPFHCYVEFNGWPAADFTPYGGAFAAGEAANEEAFVAAVEAEIAR